MRNEKKPSIYADRGTIGSADELDEYGVWVKSEPQDLSSTGIETKKSSGLSEMDDLDFSASKIDDLPDFDSLQDEILNNSAGLEEDFEIPDIGEAEDDTQEDSVVEDFDLEEFPEPEDEPESGSLDFSDLSAGDTDIDDGKNTDADDDGEFADVSLGDFIGEDLQTDTDLEKEYREEKSEAKTTESQDLSTRLLMKIADELSSIRNELTGLKKEFSVIKTAASQAETAENSFFGEEDDEKIALTGDELNNILNTADFTEEAGSDATAELNDDIDLRETEDSAEILAEFSDETLEEIPEEISDEAVLEGFTELTEDEIAADFSENIAGASAGSETAELPDFAEEADSDSSASLVQEQDSFKDLNEDDETISIMDLDINLDETNLDELEGETKLDDSADLEQAFDSGNFDIDLDDGIAPLETESGETLPEEDIPLELPDTLPDFADEETAELKQLRENGAEPMTFAPAPEDAEYLAEDPLAQDTLTQDTELSEENIFDEAIDLSEAVIDEPDLSSEIQDPPPEEPSLEDISISLDMDEDAFGAETGGDEETGFGNEDGGEEEIELSLDLPEEPENAASLDDTLSGEEFPDFSEAEDDGEGGDPSLIPEGFVVEADDAPPAFAENEEELISEADMDILGAETETEGAPAEISELEAVESAPASSAQNEGSEKIPTQLKQELKTVLSYMDQLLESLPDKKIEEFARSEYYDTYKKLFKELGLV